MVPKWRVKELLNEIEEVEEDIGILNNNISKARDYLLNTKPEDMDINYFNNDLDIERGLKHIELF